MSEKAEAIRAFIERLREHGLEHADACPRPPEHADALVHELIYSFLLWEAGPEIARDALGRCAEEIVDYNELRVCLCDELADLLGQSYPLAQERCLRMRTALNEIYERENALSLDRVADMAKRDARAYLETLPGMMPFVSARVLLLRLGGHAFPIDARLAARLAEEDAIDPDAPPDTLGTWLERTFRAGEAMDAYLLIEAWAAATSPGRKAGGRKRASGSRAGGTRSPSKRASPAKQARTKPTRHAEHPTDEPVPEPGDLPPQAT